MDRYYSSDEDRERREASSSKRKDERRERRSEKRHRRDRSKDRYRHERSRSRSHGRRSRSRSRSRSKRSRSPRRDYGRHHDSKSKADKSDSDKGATSADILNPVIFNSGRYAEQIAKRKLLWNSKKPDAAEQEVKNTAIWQSAKFSQDQDGKMTAKFQRLMGIKDNVPKPPQQDGNVKDMFKKQEELFSTMEMQYEVARATTHTQRGVGLGFGPRHIP